MEQASIKNFSHMVVTQRPFAQATLKGNDKFPNIRGIVHFYNAHPGVLVVAQAFNLPYVQSQDESQQAGPFYGFHLHEGNACGSGAGDSPFAASGNHYNPTNQPHPYHAGDFPSLLGNSSGFAYGSFYTSRLTPEEIIGKTVILHQHPDDFHSQPSGDSGMKMACGVVYTGIQPVNYERNFL